MCGCRMRRLILTAVVWCAGAVGLRAAEPDAATFADITTDSGVAQLLDDKYRADPKWWLSGVDLVDLDGDGALDLFLGAHGGGKAVAALNDGKGHFTAAPGVYPDREIYLAGDINEDGKMDLMVTHDDGAGRWWVNESSKGRLSFRKTDMGAGRTRANALIDINRDGLADWLHEGDSGIVFEFGDGKGVFKKGGGLDVVKSRNETNMIPVDLNGDGMIDLIGHWGRYDVPEGRSRIYLNDGKGGFVDVTKESGLKEEGVAIKGVGDVNQDGATDLLVLERKRPAIYLNDGHGKFAKKADALVGMEAARMPVYASWGMAVVTDFDNDGVADIIWNGRNFLWILRGLGDGKFEYANKKWGIEDLSSATVDDGICFGDFDGVGALDVIGYAGKLDGQRRLRVYRNDVARGNWLNVRLIGAAGNRGASGAKIRIAQGGKLLWYEQVLNVGSQSAHSYYISSVTERHFGLGARDSADVSVEFYPSGKKVEKSAVKGVVELKEP
jgi:hypothetical protein